MLNHKVRGSAFRRLYEAFFLCTIRTLERVVYNKKSHSLVFPWSEVTNNGLHLMPSHQSTFTMFGRDTFLMAWLNCATRAFIFRHTTQSVRIRYPRRAGIPVFGEGIPVFGERGYRWQKTITSIFTNVVKPRYGWSTSVVLNQSS